MGWALYVALVTTLYHVYTETMANLLRHLYSYAIFMTLLLKILESQIY